MNLRVFAAATLLAGSTALAMAQETPPTPPPEGGPQTQQGAPDAPPPGPEHGDNARDGHHGKRHWGHHGKHHERHDGNRHDGDRHGGHDMDGKGFELSLGHGRELRVRCGDAPIEACIDAAAPLIDSLSGDRLPHPRPGTRHGHGVQTAPDRDDRTLEMDRDDMDMDQDDMGDMEPDGSPSAKPGYHADSPTPEMKDGDD